MTATFACVWGCGLAFVLLCVPGTRWAAMLRVFQVPRMKTEGSLGPRRTGCVTTLCFYLRCFQAMPRFIVPFHHPPPSLLHPPPRSVTNPDPELCRMTRTLKPHVYHLVTWTSVCRQGGRGKMGARDLDGSFYRVWRESGDEREKIAVPDTSVHASICTRMHLLYILYLQAER